MAERPCHHIPVAGKITVITPGRTDDEMCIRDTDKTGRESSCKQEKLLEEFGVKRLLLPLPGTKEEKDISDYFKAGNTVKIS